MRGPSQDALDAPDFFGVEAGLKHVRKHSATPTALAFSRCSRHASNMPLLVSTSRLSMSLMAFQNLRLPHLLALRHATRMPCSSSSCVCVYVPVESISALISLHLCVATSLFAPPPRVHSA